MMNHNVSSIKQQPSICRAIQIHYTACNMFMSKITKIHKKITLKNIPHFCHIES